MEEVEVFLICAAYNKTRKISAARFVGVPGGDKIR